MAGHGPAPKDPDYRARGNRTDKGHEVRKIALRPAKAPVLTGHPRPGGEPWPAVTITWWQDLQRSAQAALFTELDWRFALDTAIYHAALWADGDLKAGTELRLREAKLGFTMEDRARLRLQADEDDETPSDKSQKPAAGARARAERGHLRAIG